LRLTTPHDEVAAPSDALALRPDRQVVDWLSSSACPAALASRLAGKVLAGFTLHGRADALPAALAVLPSDVYVMAVHSVDGRSRNGNGALPLPQVFAARRQVTVLHVPPACTCHLVVLSADGFVRVFGCRMQGPARDAMNLDQLVGGRLSSVLLGSLEDVPDSLRIRVLCQWLLDQIDRGHALSRGAGQSVSAAAHVAGPSAQGAGHVPELATALGAGRRQLERHLRAWLNASPALLLRVMRFQRAAGLLMEGMLPLHVARLAGFADQAHMTRSFRRFGWCTPASLLRMRGDEMLSALRQPAGRLLIAPLMQTPHDLRAWQCLQAQRWHARIAGEPSAFE
jgi:AraC-like DNA-binding protein